MKKLKFLIILFSIFLSLNLAKAAETVYFINLDYLINESIVGKSIASQIKKKHNENLSFFEKNENDFKKREIKINSQKNVLSEEEYNKKINLIRTDINQYNNLKKNRIDLLNKKMIQANNELMSELNSIIGKYAKSNSISLIIQKKNILIGKTELDITNPIFEILNKSTKSIKLK
jgi:outer membrane protein